MLWVKLAVAATLIVGLGLVAEAQAPPKGECWAVVIGVNHEKRAYATADAEAMYRVLLDHLHFKESNVTLLTDRTSRKPTLKNIVWALGTLPARVARKEDTVVIFLAGHTVIEGSSVSGRFGDLTRYLVAADSTPTDLRSTALPIDQLWSALERLDTGRLVLLMDASYSGIVGAPEASAFRARGVVRNEGRTALASSRSNEISLEAASLRHGIFSYHLIEGLKSGAFVDRAGTLSLSALYEHVREQTTQQTRVLGGNQHPVLNGDATGTLRLDRPGGP